MAEFIEKTLFERALLASQLVDAAQLAEFAQRLPADQPGFGPHSDARLAQRLIDSGLLNEWQIEQLRAGRTKFTLGPYLIVDAIGKGGMGHLFKGRHELLDRIEAIKVLPKSRSKPAAIASFHHEIRAQAQLDHPNLVRVSFAGKDGETHFLVTEFVPGVDLRRLVRRSGQLPADQAALVIMQTAEALEYAHRRGLVHRDVKPGNLLVRPDGHVKVTDLGLAWYLEDSFGAAPTGTGKIVGTCDYLAPESIRTPDKIMPVSDVYALGCTLYYAVTGKVPYPGGNAAAKLRRQVEDSPIDPRSFNPDLPTELTALIAEMMEKDHHQRTPSAAVVRDRLRELVRDDSRAALATAVAACEQQLPNRQREHSSPGDLGETLVSLSDSGQPQAGDSVQQATNESSQATDPIATAEEETLPIAPHKSALVAEAKAARRRSDKTIRMTIAAAVCASVAIVIATALSYL